MAIWVKTNGTTEVVIKDQFTLEDLQSMVDGYIEFIPLSCGDTLVVNEEGYINDLPVNDKATLVVRRTERYSGVTIVGGAVILNKEEIASLEHEIR